MSAVTPERRGRSAFGQLWHDRRDVWLRRLFNLGVALAVGFVLGKMIHQPNPRIVKAAAGLFVIYAAWRFPIPVSISAFLIMFPFPFAIAYGSSNTIFVFLITAMWLGQIVLRTETPVGRTPLDLPVILLLGAYLLSFSNVANARALAQGLINFSTILASIFVYYLIVHSVRTEKNLKRLVHMIIVTALLTFAIAIYELVLPGQPLIRGWILSTTLYRPEAIIRGLRVGGPFMDFELYAEYCALMLPLIMFHFLRAENLRSRVIWGGLTLLNFFVLMATVTRGATISLSVGGIYLLYRLRNSLSFKEFVMTISTAVLLFSGIEFYLRTYTVSGSVLDRLLDTKFINGLPDSRTFWPQIWERCKEHIWVGHGPHYEFGEYGREKLRRFFWPHNGYLYYLHTVGLLGTSAFVWILARLWWSSGRRCARSLTDPDYCKSLLLVWNTCLVIFAVDQMKIEYLRHKDYQFFPWIMFALIVATMNVMERVGAGKPPRVAVRRGVALPLKKGRPSADIT